MPLTKAQIGKCGEILVQYRFLRLGIESAPMSTDTGKYRNRFSRLLTRSSSGANDSSKNQPQGEAGGAAPERRLWIGGCHNHVLLTT